MKNPLNCADAKLSYNNFAMNLKLKLTNYKLSKDNGLKIQPAMEPRVPKAKEIITKMPLKV